MFGPLRGVLWRRSVMLTGFPGVFASDLVSSGRPLVMFGRLLAML